MQAAYDHMQAAYADYARMQTARRLDFTIVCRLRASPVWPWLNRTRSFMNRIDLWSDMDSLRNFGTR